MEKLKELDFQKAIRMIKIDLKKISRNSYVLATIVVTCLIGIYFLVLFHSQVKLDYQDFKMGVTVAKIYSVIREIVSRPMIWIQIVLVALAGYYYKQISKEKTIRIAAVCSALAIVVLGISTRSATFVTDANLTERNLVVRMFLTHKDSVRKNVVEQIKLGISDIAIEDENAQWLGTEMEGKIRLYYVKDSDVDSKTGGYKLTKKIVKKENFQKVLGGSYQVTRAKLDWKSDEFRRAFQGYFSEESLVQLFSAENDKYIVTVPVETEKNEKYLILK